MSFSNFHDMIKTQFGVRIKNFKFDNAKDILIKFCLLIFRKKELLMSHLVLVLLNKIGWLKGKLTIFLHLPCLSVPKHHQGRQFLHLPILSTDYFLKYQGSKVLCKSFLVFFPDFHTLNNLTSIIFGVVSLVHIHVHNKGKLDPQAFKCIFVGYFFNTKGLQMLPSTLWEIFCL